MSKTHRLRWFQFSVRGPLLLMAVIAIASPWWQPAAYELFFPSNQTLPAGWITNDDIQYFVPSAEFKLAREAASAKAYEEDQGSK